MARCKTAALALLLCLGLTGCGRAEKPMLTLPPVAAEAASPTPIQTEAPATELVLYPGEDGLLPVDELCAALELGLETVGENTALIGGRSLEYFPEDGYICFDGRYIYAPGGFMIDDAGLRLSREAVEKIFSLSLFEEEGGYPADLRAAMLMPGGEDYYELNFGMDLIYWLPQIIHAEAYQQPMAGLIGVGNVVMNRMEDERFPNSVTGVIFDREQVIQFEPVENGSIKAQPDERAYIAACLCLEGYSTVGESLFFVNPAYGSYWFDRELELTHVIGEHNFYKYKDMSHA